MAKQKTSTSKKDDAAWVARALTKMIIDAGFTSLEELQASDKLDGSELPAFDVEMEALGVDLSGISSTPPVPGAEPAGVSTAASRPCGTRRISIRVHERVLFAFKAQAEKTGTPYQTLMKRALDEAAERHV